MSKEASFVLSIATVRIATVSRAFRGFMLPLRKNSSNAWSKLAIDKPLHPVETLSTT